MNCALKGNITMRGLKKKLKNSTLTIGSWMTIGHPAVAEIMARSGFEWLTIDMEHSPLSIAQCQELIRVISLCGLDSLVRVGANDPLEIKRVMDAGATGVIVPMVNTAEQAKAVVAAVKYPPVGHRGVGLARAQGYGMSFKEYLRWVHEESVVIVQIEHIDAVKNIEQILSVKGVDGFIVGPYDLSGSMGIPGNFDDNRMLQAMRDILKFSGRQRMSAGIHVVSSDSAQVKVMIKQGFKFIAYGVDFLFLGESSRNGVKSLGKRVL